MKKILLSILGIAAIAVTANAQVIFNDTFSSGNITNWYSAGNATTVSAFNAGGGNEYLSINSNNNTGASQHAFRAFTGTTLADGETLRLTIDVAQLNSQPNADNSIGFVLFNTSSSYTSNQTSETIWASGSKGYRFFLSTGTNTASRLGWTNLGATNNPFAGNSNIYGNGTTSGTLTAGTTVTFDITRVSASSLNLTVKNGSTTLFSAVDTAGQDYSAFNTLAIGYMTISAASRNIRLDSVQLEVIPEPTTWALLAGSLTTLMIFRRRHQNLKS